MDINEAVWTAAHVNDLPDSAFAYISPGGSKDGAGKTVPRSLRHLPYKDASGKVDAAHVRNALARLPQMNISAEAKASAKSKLIAAARSVGVEVSEEIRQTEEVELQERVDAKPDRVEGDTIYGVALLKGQSANGRTYPTETMQRAIPMFEGRPVYANHSGPGRDVRDLIGVLRNARFERDAVRADLDVLESQGAWLLEAAEKAPEAVGLSIDGRGVVNKNKGVVEQITRINSVDVVAHPATVAGLFEEQRNTAKEAEMEQELKEAKAKVAELTEQVEKVTAERDEITAKVRELEEAKTRAEHRAAIALLISEAGLPEGAVTETFRETLEGIAVEKAKKLIEERVRMVKAIKAKAPVSKEADIFNDKNDAVTEEKMVEAIKG